MKKDKIKNEHDKHRPLTGNKAKEEFCLCEDEPIVLKKFNGKWICETCELPQAK